MFDLNRLKAEATEYSLRDAEGKVRLDPDGNPAVLILVGTDSPQFEAQQRANGAKARARKAEGREATPEESLAEFVDLLVACTTGWRNVGIGEDAQPLEFTAENVRKIYTGWPLIRDQVDAFVVKRGNFIKG